MIFVGPYLNNPNSHFNMNVVDSIGSENDLVIDIKENNNYLEEIEDYLKYKNIEDEICIYNPFEKEDFVIRLKKVIPNLKIFMYCSDDEWRCFNYDRYLALYVNFFSITTKVHLEYYKKWGFNNVIGTNWACNPKMFYPVKNIEKKYDVTFIGSAYGQRVDYVREAIKSNINIKVFGKGWDKYRNIKPYWGGYISSEEMNLIINQSKINLNFMWSSSGGYQVKGRNFELAACKVFQLCNYGNELLEYFTPRIDIDTFNNKDEFVAKIHFYLKHEQTREDIANNSFKEVTEKHTWDAKFKEIFNFGINKQPIKLKIYNILVLNKDNVKHSIDISDSRLNIDIKEDKNIEYDGIIKLTTDTTINNETLLMMAFGLSVDKSDIIISNFFTIDNIWIRFKNKDLNKHTKLFNLIPLEAMMFSNINILNSYLSDNNVISYIEYPSFSIQKINYTKKLLLNFLFSSYHQREIFETYKKQFNIWGMFKIGVEYFMRRLVLK